MCLSNKRSTINGPQLFGAFNDHLEVVPEPHLLSNLAKVLKDTICSTITIFAR